MASLSKDKNGNRTIQFTGGDRKRRSIRLGKMPQKIANTIKANVEALNAANIAGHGWDPHLAAWVAGLGDKESWLYDRIANAGLIPKRTPPEYATLGGFLDSYIKSRGDVKGGTTIVYGHTRRCLIGYFGEKKPLEEITLADADDWRRWLAADQGLAENTVRRRCGIARQFFRAAERKRLIKENPFGDMKGVSVKSNRARDYFITRAEAAKVLDNCPDNEWRLIFALSRYGGLRCPSEHLALTWRDIDWDNQRITIRSAKTEHHDGQGIRVIPLFPELKPYLETAYDLAPEGAEFVIANYRDSNTNLRSRLLDIIALAGLKPWPKLFQNLRASRATELAAEYPAHVAADWLGHSTMVAQKHYWQTTDSDFDKAVSTESDSLQNAVQSEAATDSEEQKPNKEPVETTASNDGLRLVTSCTVGDTGSIQNPPNGNSSNELGKPQAEALARSVVNSVNSDSEDPEKLRQTLADILAFVKRHPELAREHLHIEVESSPFTTDSE